MYLSMPMLSITIAVISFLRAMEVLSMEREEKGNTLSLASTLFLSASG